MTDLKKKLEIGETMHFKVEKISKSVERIEVHTINTITHKSFYYLLYFLCE